MKSSESKSKYFREKQAKCRNQASTPQRKVRVASHDHPVGLRGRPALFGAAMSPRSLNKRRSFLKKKQKISEIRKKAANERWDSGKSSDGFEFDDEGNIHEEQAIEDDDEDLEKNAEAADEVNMP